MRTTNRFLEQLTIKSACTILPRASKNKGVILRQRRSNRPGPAKHGLRIPGGTLCAKAYYFCDVLFTVVCLNHKQDIMAVHCFCKNSIPPVHTVYPAILRVVPKFKRYQVTSEEWHVAALANQQVLLPQQCDPWFHDSVAPHSLQYHVLRRYPFPSLQLQCCGVTHSYFK